MLLALLGEAQHDAEMAGVFITPSSPPREREREMIKPSRRATAGSAHVDVALDALSGPIVYRALTGAPIPRSFVDGLVADILDRHRA